MKQLLIVIVFCLFSVTAIRSAQALAECGPCGFTTEECEKHMEERRWERAVIAECNYFALSLDGCQRYIEEQQWKRAVDEFADWLQGVVSEATDWWFWFNGENEDVEGSR